MLGRAVFQLYSENLRSRCPVYSFEPYSEKGMRGTAASEILGLAIDLLNGTDKTLSQTVNYKLIDEIMTKEKGVVLYFYPEREIVVNGEKLSVSQIVIPFCPQGCEQSSAPFYISGKFWWRSHPYVNSNGGAIVNQIAQKIKK